MFWNEDDSQILCKTHRIEHISFSMTRAAFKDINVKVEKT